MCFVTESSIGSTHLMSRRHTNRLINFMIAGNKYFDVTQLTTSKMASSEGYQFWGRLDSLDNKAHIGFHKHTTSKTFVNSFPIRINGYILIKN